MVCYVTLCNQIALYLSLIPSLFDSYISRYVTDDVYLQYHYHVQPNEKSAISDPSNQTQVS
jgi:hypothetical protein